MLERKGLDTTGDQPRKCSSAAATFITLSTSAFADQNSENANRMDELRRAFFEMTAQMIDDEIATSEMHMKRLTNYQRILRQMMQSENSSSNNQADRRNGPAMSRLLRFLMSRTLLIVPPHHQGGGIRSGNGPTNPPHDLSNFSRQPDAVAVGQAALAQREVGSG